MKPHEIEELINSALNKTAPKEPLPIQPDVILRSEQKGITMKRKNFSRLIGGAVAACLAFGICGTYYSRAFAVSSIVSLDVNPSIELRVNSREKVLSCKPLNDEAVTILSDMDNGDDLKGIELNVAVNALIGALVRNGYLDDISSSILISVEDKNSDRAAKLRREVTETVDAVLSANLSRASVRSQSFSKDSELETIASKYNISTGKAAMIAQICAINQLDKAALSALSVDELSDLLEIGAPAMPIGREKAVSIALADCKVTPTSYEIDSDIDDTPSHYDVEIVSGEIVYEYKIEAFTGEIIKAETEREDDIDLPTIPTPVYEPTEPVARTIDIETAKSIALSHAGVNKAAVKELEAEADYDDGVLEYEIEFKFGGFEYEYKLDASGVILEHEIEVDD